MCSVESERATEYSACNRREQQVFIAQDFTQSLEPVGKDGREPTEAELAAAAAHRAAQSTIPPTAAHTAAAVPATVAHGLKQHAAMHLPEGVLDDGLRNNTITFHTLGKITLDHEAVATKMVQRESDMELTEQFQKSLYVEPISFTQTLFSEHMYPKPPGPTPPSKPRIRKVRMELSSTDACLLYTSPSPRD